MDGLLIDSEPLWQEAEIKIFKSVGLELSIENCLETTGLPTRDVINYWFDKKPWTGLTKLELEKSLYREVIHLIEERAEPMLGVVASLEFFKGKGKAIGLASASPLPIIEASLQVCKLGGYFDFVHSGTLEENNKPHPALYQTVANKLNCNIENCLILEDSGNGVLGATKTDAAVVAVPAAHDYDAEVFDKANYKISSLLFLPKIIKKDNL